MNNELFDFFQVQINELINKAKQLKSDDDQKFASIVLEDTIEICNDFFQWNLAKVKDL